MSKGSQGVAWPLMHRTGQAALLREEPACACQALPPARRIEEFQESAVLRQEPLPLALRRLLTRQKVPPTLEIHHASSASRFLGWERAPLLVAAKEGRRSFYEGPVESDQRSRNMPARVLVRFEIQGPR